MPYISWRKQEVRRELNKALSIPKEPACKFSCSLVTVVEGHTAKDSQSTHTRPLQFHSLLSSLGFLPSVFNVWWFSPSSKKLSSDPICPIPFQSKMKVLERFTHFLRLIPLLLLSWGLSSLMPFHTSEGYAHLFNKQTPVMVSDDLYRIPKVNSQLSCNVSLDRVLFFPSNLRIL